MKEKQHLWLIRVKNELKFLQGTEQRSPMNTPNHPPINNVEVYIPQAINVIMPFLTAMPLTDLRGKGVCILFQTRKSLYISTATICTHGTQLFYQEYIT